MFARIYIRPANDPTADPTLLNIYSGNVAQEDTDLTRSFTFTVPHGRRHIPFDYGDDLLVSGAWIEVWTSLTGSFSESDAKCWFWGAVCELDTERQQQPEGANSQAPSTGTYHAYDPLKRALSVGVNISFANKVLVADDVFTDADFEPGDDEFFLVHIPSDLSNPVDWVPEGLISLVAYKTTGGDDDESGMIDYDKSEFVYSAVVEEIMFTRSQEEPGGPDDTSPQADYEWRIKRLYYDPNDIVHTVTNLILQVLTGSPNSDAGGCGFDPADIDLEEIYGFDGVTPKKVRAFVWDKTNGPAGSAFDKMREMGLIPINYRLGYNPTTRKVEGRHDEQDNDAVVTLGKTLNEKMPYTIEDAALRVECWSKAVTPENYALVATATLNPPAGYSTFPAADADLKLVDGKPGTSLQFQKELTTLNYPPVATDSNAIVLDLGKTRRIGEVNFRGASPKEEDGSDIIEIPVYFESRMPKISISMTDDPTDLVGVPVSPDAISFKYSPREPDQYADGRFDTSLLNTARYIIARWEQDYFYRRDGNNIGGTARQSNYPVSEIRVLGDGRYRYPDGHPEEGELPSAYLTNKGDDISNFSLVSKRIEITPEESELFVSGELVMLWDTSADEPFDGLWTVDVVTPLLGTISFLEALPAAIAIGDKMGPYKRWMQALDNSWVDLRAEKLYQKLLNTTNRTELVTDYVPASIAEAEQLCVSRLRTLNTISRDYEVEVPLRHDVDMGTTIRAYSNRPEWLVRQFQLNLPAPDTSGKRPPITLNFGGNDYEEPMQ